MPPTVSRRGLHAPPERGEPFVRLSDRSSSSARQRHPRKSAWRHRKLCLYFLGLSLLAAWLFFLVSFPQIGEGGAREVGGGKEERIGKGKWVLPFDGLVVERRVDEERVERERSMRGESAGMRMIQLALVLAPTNEDVQFLMLLTLAKGLTELGYNFTIFTLEEKEIDHLFKNIGYDLHFFDSEGSKTVDWSNYEGVIVGSLEAKQVLSSLAQEPFLSTPLIWLINEDNLGKRLREYKDKGFDDLISHWRNDFRRADIIVFPDFSLPLLYAPLGLTNSVVIPGSPAIILQSETYIASNSRDSVRNNYGFKEGDFVILVVRSYFVFDEIPWDYVAVIEALAPQVLKVKRNLDGRVKVVFLHGNSSDVHKSSFEELAKKMGFSDGSIRHYPLNHDVNALLLLSDIVLYGSFQEEHCFPPLLLRAMSFGVPVIAPNISQVTKHVTHGVNGFLFDPNDSTTLAKAFSLTVKELKVSELAKNAAKKAKLLSKNMLVFDFISSHAKLLETILSFPSDVMLPSPVSHIQQKTWLWNLVRKERNKVKVKSIVDKIEEQFVKNLSKKSSEFENGVLNGEFSTKSDWDEISELEISEDIERIEVQELEERMENPLKTWETVYHTSRRIEKSKSVKAELDDGVLERTGQPVCIYEIYNGDGSWPFLHHGSLYRAISLSRNGRREGTDDVDAPGRLRILGDKYYRDLLCEFGAILSVANQIDSVHNLPWIGFQSWRAASKKVSLSKRAEEKLETITTEGNHGDAVYYWGETESNLDFWSTCDHLNAGQCRSLFSKAFRHMYGLSDDVAALPPMPGSHWSTLHSWVMPTPSFLEFIIFSRMFLDSLDRVSYNSRDPSACLLGSSALEKRQCYCRVLDLLINIWAYHSSKRIFYLDPKTGALSEQNPLANRGAIWSKYFEFTLLKSMDEDLAEEADDCTRHDDVSGDRWMWALTGEVHWQGVYDKEREERYVRKMDKKRKTKEKLLDRFKFGYKQKAIE
ncbi:hypothetical protein LUZ60_014465 [Juncus effusus]|nr:hypothetical protein LUZ60_014465 [Juncus effusus]